MRWQGKELRLRSPLELRESGGYSDAIIKFLLTRAEGSDADVNQLAMVEFAASQWARAFATARVQPEELRDVITPEVLHTLGSELIRCGEVLYAIQIDADEGLRLSPAASSWTVSGGSNPKTWMVQAEIPGPTKQESQTLSWEGICHFAWRREAARPWRGISPWEGASRSASLAANIEKSLTEECSTPTGFLLPVPAGMDADREDDPVKELNEELRKLYGGLYLIESSAGGFGEGALAGPQREWQPIRIGPLVPESLCKLRGNVMVDLLTAAGIPPPLGLARSDGTLYREAWRNFLFGSVAPKAREVEAEFSRKLNQEVRLTFSDLRASDLTGRARAYKSLREAGMEESQAARVAGLEEEVQS